MSSMLCVNDTFGRFDNRFSQIMTVPSGSMAPPVTMTVGRTKIPPKYPKFVRNITPMRVKNLILPYRVLLVINFLSILTPMIREFHRENRRGIIDGSDELGSSLGAYPSISLKMVASG